MNITLAFFGVGAVQLFATKTLDLNDFFLTAAFFAPTYAVALTAKRKWFAGGAVAVLIALNLVGAITQTIF